MEKIANLFGAYQKPPSRQRRSERSDLLETFLLRLNPGRKAKGYPPLTYGRLAYLLAGIKTADLYYLLSVCTDAERRGYPFSAIFWRELKPKQSTKL
jgi:hypothetical protein